MTSAAASSAPVAPAVRLLRLAPCMYCQTLPLPVLRHPEVTAANAIRLAQLQVWRAGTDAMQEGEALDYDPTAYDCLHQFTLDWPCLR